MWSVWYDKESIPVGEEYRDLTKKSLECAACVVTLWSRNSVKSNWVLAEAAAALKDKKLLPVSLDNAVIPMPFEELQTGDLSIYPIPASIRSFCGNTYCTGAFNNF